MQQIIFKRKIFRSIDVVKTGNAQCLEEKKQPIQKIIIEKIQEKNDLKFEF